jgi:peptidoglycan/LPS O-acetylase OafA/YrhL
MQQKSQGNAALSAPGGRSTISRLDVIRALAMFAVFSHHLWKTVIVAPQGRLQNTLNVLFDTASDGVIVFNIISGFLLAMPYLCPGGRPFPGYHSFLKKRFLRIIPPYYIALLLFTLANIVHFDFPLTSAFNVFLQHLSFTNSLNYSNMFLNLSHFWYLGLLAQFYLLFPCILALFLRIGAAGAALSIIVLSWGGWMVLAWCFPTTDPTYPSMAENLMHFNLPGRLPEFAIGMWLASFWNGSAPLVSRTARERAFFLFTAAMLIYFIAFAGTGFPSDMSLPLVHIFHVALCEVLLLILLVWPLIAKMGEFALLKAAAQRSYTIYIVHLPLFSYLGVMPSKVTHTLGNFFTLMALLLPLSYLMAKILDWFSAKVAEKLSGRRQSQKSCAKA